MIAALPGSTPIFVGRNETAMLRFFVT